MPNRHPTTRPPGPQRGFSLIAAVFLITAVAAIAVISVSLSATRSVSTGQSLQAARAFFAARSGIEYAVARAFPAGQGCAEAVAGSPLNIEGFNVAIACAADSTVDEAGEISAVYTLSATATAGNLNNSNFVSRRLQVVVGGQP